MARTRYAIVVSHGRDLDPTLGLDFHSHNATMKLNGKHIEKDGSVRI